MANPKRDILLTRLFVGKLLAGGVAFLGVVNQGIFLTLLGIFAILVLSVVSWLQATKDPPAPAKERRVR